MVIPTLANQDLTPMLSTLMYTFVLFLQSVWFMFIILFTFKCLRIGGGVLINIRDGKSCKNLINGGEINGGGRNLRNSFK